MKDCTIYKALLEWSHKISLPYFTKLMLRLDILNFRHLSIKSIFCLDPEFPLDHGQVSWKSNLPRPKMYLSRASGQWRMSSFAMVRLRPCPPYFNVWVRAHPPFDPLSKNKYPGINSEKYSNYLQVIVLSTTYYYLCV